MKYMVRCLKGAKVLKGFCCVLLIMILLAATFISSVYAAGNELLENGDFEMSAAPLPVGWKVESFIPAKSKVKIETDAKSGRRSLSITNMENNDTKLSQNVNITSEKIYQVSCWVKTENLEGLHKSANITLLTDTGIYTSRDISDTGGEWENLLFYIQPQKAAGTHLNFSVRLGGQGTVCQGKVYFDNVSMKQVDSIPPDAKVEQFYIPPELNESDTGTPPVGTQEIWYKTIKELLFILIRFVLGRVL